MVSFKASGLAIAALFASIATSTDYHIAPDSVPLSLRQAWCQDQQKICPMICQQTQPRTTLINDCDSDSLTYDCLCGNNKQPNLSEYSLTLPFYICQEWGNQCVTACNNDNTCASKCREDHPCGATNPKRYNSTATATSGATATDAGDDVIFTGVPGESNAESGSGSGNHKGAGTALEVSRSYGLAIVLFSLFAGFAML